MVKKFIAVMISAVMALSALAGCGNGAGEEDKTTTTAGQSSATTTAALPAEKKELEITFGHNDLNKPVSEDELGRIYESKLKIKVSNAQVDPEKLKLMAASDTLPDAFTTTLGSMEFNTFLSDDLLRDIPDSMLSKYPILSQQVQSNGFIEGYKKSYGKNVALPKVYSASNRFIAGQSAIFYRADWAKNVGITKEPQTIDELYEMLKAFAQKDPDGNGKPDTYGTTGTVWAAHYSPWTDTVHWIKENGQWMPGYVSDSAIGGLKFYNRLYTEKIMDPEFATAKLLDLFYANKVGMIIYNADMYWYWRIVTDFQTANPDLPKDAVKVMAPPKLDANTPAKWVSYDATPCLAISKKVDDEKLDRILELCEFLLSPEGLEMGRWGIEGKDYVKEGDKYKNIRAIDEKTGKPKTLWVDYGSLGLRSIIAYDTDFSVSDEQNDYGPEFLQAEKQIRDRYNPAAYKPNPLIELLVTPAKSSISISVTGYQDEFARIIAGNNVEEDFKAFKNKVLEVNGVQAAIDEVNKEVAAKGLDK